MHETPAVTAVVNKSPAGLDTARSLPQTYVKHVRWLGVLPSLMFPALLLWALHAHGVNVPCRDELSDFTSFADNVLHHRVGIKDFFLQQNEHRHASFRILSALLIHFTNGWHIRYERLLHFLMTVIGFLLILGLSAKSLDRPFSGEAKLLAAATSALIFSLTQWESWSIPLDMSRHICNAAFLAAVLTLCRFGPTWKHVFLAAFFCLIASFSFGNGLVSWIALYPLTINARKANIKFSGFIPYAWALLFLLTALAYFHGYRKPEYLPNLKIGVKQPGDFFSFLCLFLGLPFSLPRLHFTGLLGLAQIILVMFLMLNTPTRKKMLSNSTLPWLCLYLFCFLSGFVAAICRVGLGVESAVRSAYAVTSSLGWIAIFYLFHLCCPGWKKSFIFSLLAIIGSQIWFDRHAWIGWRRYATTLRQSEACLETYPVSSERCLSELLFKGKNDGELVRNLAPTLENLGVFKSFALPPDLVYLNHSGKGLGRVSSILPERGTQRTLQAEGWALMWEKGSPQHVVLTCGKDRKFLASTVTVLDRPEIAQLYGDQYLESGWSLEFKREQFRGSSKTDPVIEAWIYDEQEHALIRMVADIGKKLPY